MDCGRLIIRKFGKRESEQYVNSFGYKNKYLKKCTSHKLNKYRCHWCLSEIRRAIHIFNFVYLQYLCFKL